MPPWLLIWIFRFGRGERFRKATPGERRYGTGLFLIVAVLFIAVELSNHLGHTQSSLYDRTSPLVLWLCATAFMVALVFGSFFWARLVPARISGILAVVAWAVLLSLIFYFEWL
jgi:small-conductance mechanosensitive channel